VPHKEALRENTPLLYHKNDKKSAFSAFSFTPYPAKGQELQVSDVQLAHALPVSETGEPSELLENNESTRWALPPQLGHKAAPPA